MLACTSECSLLYVLLILLTHPIGSPSGRAFPDVAAQGLNYQVIVGGKLYSIGGTSASAPVRSHLPFNLREKCHQFHLMQIDLRFRDLSHQ